MRNIDLSSFPDGEIVCHTPDGSIYKLVEPDYWQLVTLAPKETSGAEPAFGEFKQAGHCSIKTGGISVRDYFAAHATKAADDEVGVLYAEAITGRSMPDFAADPVGNSVFWADYRARMRYIEADAMIDARAKGESK